MYKQYLKLINNKVISTIEIPANVPILEFGGDVFTSSQIKDDNALQIGHDLYLGYSGGIDDEITHSCNPNCYVRVLGKRAILYSLYILQENMVVSYDYSTTSTDALKQWSMNCSCGDYNCRKVISRSSKSAK